MGGQLTVAEEEMGSLQSFEIQERCSQYDKFVQTRTYFEGWIIADKSTKFNKSTFLISFNLFRVVLLFRNIIFVFLIIYIYIYIIRYTDPIFTYISFFYLPVHLSLYIPCRHCVSVINVYIYLNEEKKNR